MPVYRVKDFQKGMRLDKVLVAFMPDKSRNYIAKLIDDEQVLVNQKIGLLKVNKKVI